MEQAALTELVVRAQAGDDTAFAQLFEAGKGKVYYIGLSMLKNEQDAQDLVQDVFITVYRQLEGLKEPEAYKGWLNRIAANRCRDRLAKKGEVLFSGEEEAYPEEADEDGESLPESAYEQRETAARVLALVAALPEEQRMVVLLYYYGEMKTAEVAAVLGVSEGTVKSRLSYARKKLRVGATLEEEKNGRLLSVSPAMLLGLMQKDALAKAGELALTAGDVLAGAGAAAAAGGVAAAGKGVAAGLSGTAKLLLGAAAALVVAVGGLAVWNAARPGEAAGQPEVSAVQPAPQQPMPGQEEPAPQGTAGTGNLVAAADYLYYMDGSPVDLSRMPVIELYNVVVGYKVTIDNSDFAYAVVEKDASEIGLVDREDHQFTVGITIKHQPYEGAPLLDERSYENNIRVAVVENPFSYGDEEDRAVMVYCYSLDEAWQTGLYAELPASGEVYEKTIAAMVDVCGRMSQEPAGSYATGESVMVRHFTDLLLALPDGRMAGPFSMDSMVYSYTYTGDRRDRSGYVRLTGWVEIEGEPVEVRLTLRKKEGEQHIMGKTVGTDYGATMSYEVKEYMVGGELAGYYCDSTPMPFDNPHNWELWLFDGQGNTMNMNADLYLLPSWDSDSPAFDAWFDREFDIPAAELLDVLATAGAKQ